MGCNCGSGDKNAVLEVNSIDCTQEEHPCPVPDTSTLGCPPACTCGCSPCQCQPCAVATPKPFYAQAPGCQEEHTRVLLQQNFVTNVATGGLFNIPVCGAQVSVLLPGVQSLLVGGYLWNPVYGYLKVVSFDFSTGRAVVENECQEGNASPGTEVPSCTKFNVVDAPYEPGTECGEGVFATADFTVPAVGSSVTIDVSNIVGINVGSQVQIVDGVYDVVSIVTPFSITIKNTGSGAVAGTVVPAKDVSGNCVAPVTPVIPDPCVETPTEIGSLVVCTGTGLTTLKGHAVGEVPVCTDPDENEFQSQTVYIEQPICDELHSCLTIPAGSTGVLVYVDDSSKFDVGDVVVIQFPGVDTIFFVVSAVNWTGIANTILVAPWDPDTVSDEVDNIPAGTPVCKASCCQQMRYTLEHPCNLDWSDAQQTAHGIVWDADESGKVLSPGDPAWTSDTKTITIKNDTYSDMRVIITVDFILQGTFNICQNTWVETSFKPAVNSGLWPPPGGGPTPVPVTLRDLIEEKYFGCGPGGDPCDSYDANWYAQYHHTEIVKIPSQQEMKYSANLEFTYMKYKSGKDACCACGSISDEGTSKFTITAANSLVHALAVAVLNDGCVAPP